MKNLMQVIPNKPIACDNAPCSKTMCQEVTGEASKLSDLLIRQEEFTQSFPRVTQRGWKLQQAQQPGRQENNWRSHSKEAPSSLENWIFTTVGYSRTAHKSLIQLHPISTSGAHCSLRDATNCSTRTWECSRSAPSLYCFTSKLGINVDSSFVYLYFLPSREDSSLLGTARRCSVADAVSTPASQQLCDACDFQGREGPLLPSWAERNLELAATLGTRVRQNILRIKTMCRICICEGWQKL